MQPNADLKGALKTKSPDSDESEEENETPEQPVPTSNIRQTSQISSAGGETKVSFAATK